MNAQKCKNKVSQGKQLLKNHLLKEFSYFIYNKNLKLTNFQTDKKKIFS